MQISFFINLYYLYFVLQWYRSKKQYLTIFITIKKKILVTINIYLNYTLVNRGFKLNEVTFLVQRLTVQFFYRNKHN